MPLVAQLAALLAAAIHVWFFVLESLLFGRPGVAARFGLRTDEQIAAVRPMAFNQGFYNLFLAIGIAAGIAQIASGAVVAGRSVVLFCCLCMVWAGIVLLVTSRRFLQAALVQLLPPLVAIIATFVIPIS
jgi:putative membrane protein